MLACSDPVSALSALPALCAPCALIVIAAKASNRNAAAGFGSGNPIPSFSGYV